MSEPKRFVYVLVSEADPHRHYVGLTSNVATRLAVHNSGGSQHTAADRPWKLIVSLEFSDERRPIREVLEVRVRSRVREATLQLAVVVALCQCIGQRRNAPTRGNGLRQVRNLHGESLTFCQ